MIPMLDLKPQYKLLKDEIDEAVANVLLNTQFIMGPNVIEFEKEAAQFLGVKHAISCNSGTDALHLALRACGITEKDEVITTAYTFGATAEAICYVGATPVFVDIDPDTLNISLDAIRNAITERTRAILPVHIFGRVANILEICEFANQFNLLVIEDCAQSFGAHINGKQTGSFGVAGCFSFFPSKNLGCFGDGGLFTTNSDELADKFYLLKSHGSKNRNHHEIIGWNSRLDELQAVILRIKLKYVDKFNKQRISVAEKYTQIFNDLPIQTPAHSNDLTHVYHQYTILSGIRDEVAKQLVRDDIGHAIYYPLPLSEQPSFSRKCIATELGTTKSVCSKCLSLPIYPEMPDSQIEAVANSVRRAYN